MHRREAENSRAVRQCKPDEALARPRSRSASSGRIGLVGLPGGSGSTHYLLGVLAWSALLLLLAGPTVGVAFPVLDCPGYPFSQRCFHELRCNGTYDKSHFDRLVNVCDDCYHLYGNDRVYNGCMTDCFRHGYFEACLVSLLLIDEKKKFQEMVDYLAGK